MIAAMPITMRELAARHAEHAAVYYRKHGRPTSEVERLAAAMGIACAVAGGDRPAADFGPDDLRAARQVLIDRGNCRRTINAQAKRIRTVMRWGVSHRLVPAQTLIALECVAPLKLGRTLARESPGLEPVREDQVQAVVWRVDHELGAMIWLQWHTGMRSGELVQMRRCDIEQPTAGAWIYRPPHHKTEHHGRQRVIVLGPRARAIVAPVIDQADDAWLFPTVAAEQPVFTNRRGRPWTVNAYRQAIVRACRRAGIEPWTPHQLRHAAATRLRALVGLDTTRAILGHSRAAVTEIYAERDFQAALDAVELVG